MNAPAPIKTLDDAHRRAIEDANRWRGHCVNLFARGEMIVSEALLARLESKSLPLVFSQRVGRLAALIEGDQKQSAAVKDFQLQTSDRNVIVHGVGKVYVDGQGRWMLTLHALDRSGSTQHHVLQAWAEQRARDLTSAVQRLSAAFRT